MKITFGTIMKWWVIFIVALLVGVKIFGEDLSESPSGKSSLIKVSDAALAEMIVLVRKRGWTCDNVYSAYPAILGQKFVMVCDEGRYVYNIRDEGGIWSAYIDD